MGLMDTIKGWFGTAKGQGTEFAAEAEPQMGKAEDFAHDATDSATANVHESPLQREASTGVAEEE